MYKNCLIIGKFMPPHKGHEYMIRFAKNYASDVHVVVDCLEGQTISPLIRKQWLEDIAGIKVYALNKFMPQDPSETPQFWEIWKSTLLNTLGFKPDLTIAAMDYGWELAKVMECDFVPIDIARETFPVSATMLRENAFQNWDFLMDSAKPYFLKKICLLGPESTGKSTAGKTLAKKLNTVYVPEYAKAIIEKQGDFYQHNVKEVAIAQINTEKALARFTNKLMICDSSALTTLLYSELLFNEKPRYLTQMVEEHRYDLYCLFYPDTLFVDDVHRKVLDNPQNQRLAMFNSFEEQLKALNVRYEIIKGSFEERDSRLWELAQNELG
jgi:HTH-type transcriptional regulator, transcriptional repressor of NAD biosynthesis genes